MENKKTAQSKSTGLEVRVRFMTICLLSALFFVAGARANESGAYDMIPGSNTIEREIMWAWKSLPDFLRACAYSADCQLDPNQRQIVLKASLASHPATDIIFVSEKDFAKGKIQGFSSTEGDAHRLAITGDQPGSKIYINTSAYAQSNQSLGIPFWLGVFTHELMHHQGLKDDAKRWPDQIGSKIAQAADRLLIKINVPEDRDEAVVWILNPPVPDSTETFLQFPQGTSFKMLKMDRTAAADDVSILASNQLTPICEDTDQSVSKRVTPEALRIVKDVRPGSKANAQRATLTLSVEAICFNKTKFSALRERGGYDNTFDVNQGAGELLFNFWGTSGWATATSATQIAFDPAVITSWTYPKTVAASDEIIIEANVTAPPGRKFVGCSAFLSNSDWIYGDSPMPMSVLPDHCEMKELSPDHYALKMTRKITAQTPAQRLEVLNLCLTLPNVPDNCLPAYPQRKSFIEISNPQIPSLLRLLDARLDKNVLILRMEGASGLESLSLGSAATGSDQGEYGLHMSLYSYDGVAQVVTKLAGLPNSDQIETRSSLILPKLGSVMMTRMLGEDLYVITRDLKYAHFNLRSLKLQYDGGSAR